MTWNTTRPQFIEPLRPGPRTGHPGLLTLLVWMLPFQTFLFVPQMPYISPPAILPAFLGLLVVLLDRRINVVAVVLRRSVMIGPIVVFVIFALCHGVVVDLIRSNFGGPSVLTGEYIRQAMSLLSGFGVFLGTRLLLSGADLPGVLRSLRSSGFPHIVVGVGGLAAAILGLSAFDDVLAAVRSIVIPSAESYTNSRATSLFTEPSYFGIVIASIYLPTIFPYLASAQGRASTLLQLGAAVLSIAATASLTAFLTVIAALIHQAVSRLRNFLVIVPVAVLLIWILAFADADGAFYATAQLNAALDGLSEGAQSTSISFLDTWYSYAGPLSSYDMKLFFGVGLGGTGTHIETIFPPVVREALLESFEKDRIGVLVARVFVEQGVLGLFLFIRIWSRAWKLSTSTGTDRTPSGASICLKWAIVTSFAGLFLKLGSFSLPYMWVMFAFIDEYAEQSAIRSKFTNIGVCLDPREHLTIRPRRQRK